MEIFAWVTVLNSIAILLLAASISRLMGTVKQIINVCNWLYLNNHSEEALIEFEVEDDE